MNTSPNPEPRTSNSGRWKARLIILLLIGSAIAGLGYGGRYAYNLTQEKIIKISSPGTAPMGENRDADQPKAIALAEDLSQRIEMHNDLPERSMLSVIGFSRWSPDQASNTASMGELLEVLATEIGSNQSLGALRTLKENQEEESSLAALGKSSDPEIRQAALARFTALEKENEQLEAAIGEALGKEGLPLTKEQIRALCASPNAEDTTSMISAFGTLKAIAEEMENRLRAKPCQEHAQRYYGAHCVLLMALDKIQKDVANRIESVHLPKAQEIAAEAEATSEEAALILENDHGDLSLNEKTALNWNMDSCKKTVEMSIKTQEKLEKNLNIIRKANKKLEKSIATAKNSHMTAMLQKEIMRLDLQGAQEFAKIEALTIPELAAVNFADPENPYVSPPTRQGARP